MRTRPKLFVTLFAAVALIVAACGADPADEAEEPLADDEAPEDEAPEDEAPENEAPEDEAPEDEAPEDEAAAVLAVAETSLGTHLVDGDGMTLYLFTQDPPGESVCEDDCAATWPPLTVDGDVPLDEDVDADLVGTITRSDGSEQVTYADQPLYYFAADESAGDVEGQGVNEVWFVVATDGSAVQDGADDDNAGPY